MIFPHKTPGSGRQAFVGGFALPSAIFLVVVLAALAGFISNLSVVQQAGHMADIRGIRAYQAARAGVEWGLFDLLRNNACVGAGTTIAPGGGLAEFTVTVVCLPNGAAATNTEVATDLVVRRIVATACNQPAAGVCPNPVPGNNYVERQISIVAGR